MNKKQLNKYCKIDEESEEIMKSAIDNLKLSVRMFDKILKVSRTIADLDGEENIKKGTFIGGTKLSTKINSTKLIKKNFLITSSLNTCKIA